MSKIVCIYKITSPSGKIYIGQSRNFFNRKKDYERGRYKNQTRIENSIKKYGWDKHIIEIIENCKFEDLNIRERYWQDHYNVIGRNGLNCVLQQTDTLPKKMSEETRLNTIKTLKKYNDNKNIPIYQYDLFGILVKTWKNYNKIKRVTLFDVRYISMCCNKKHNKAYEFLWSFSIEKYDEEFLLEVQKTKSDKLKGHSFNKGRVLTEEHKLKIGLSSKGRTHNIKTKKSISKSLSKGILQYTKNGIFVRQWESASEAGRKLKVSSQNISKCALGKLKSSCGYIWKFE